MKVARVEDYSLAMARLMASGWADRDIADRTNKRRKNHANRLVVTEVDRLGIKSVVVATMARLGGGGYNRAMAMDMAAGQWRLESG